MSKTFDQAEAERKAQQQKLNNFFASVTNKNGEINISDDKLKVSAVTKENVQPSKAETKMNIYKNVLNGERIDISTPQMWDLVGSEKIEAFAKDTLKKIKDEKDAAFEGVISVSKKKNIQYEQNTDIYANEITNPDECLAHITVNLAKLNEKMPEINKDTMSDNQINQLENQYIEEKKNAFKNIEALTKQFNELYEEYNIKNKAYNTKEYRTFQYGKDIVDDIESSMTEIRKELSDPVIESESSYKRQLTDYEKRQQTLQNEINNYLNNHADRTYKFEKADDEPDFLNEYYVAPEYNYDAEKVISNAVSYVNMKTIKRDKDGLLAEEATSLNDNLSELDNLIDNATKKLDKEKIEIAKSVEAENNQIAADYDKAVTDIEAEYKAQTERNRVLTEKFQKLDLNKETAFTDFNKGIEELKNPEQTFNGKKVSDYILFMKPEDNAKEKFKENDVPYYDSQIAEIDAKINALNIEKNNNLEDIKTIDMNTGLLNYSKSSEALTEELKNFEAESAKLGDILKSENQNSILPLENFVKENPQYPVVKEMIDKYGRCGIEAKNASNEYLEYVDKNIKSYNDADKSLAKAQENYSKSIKKLNSDFLPAKGNEIKLNPSNLNSHSTEFIGVMLTANANITMTKASLDAGIKAYEQAQQDKQTLTKDDEKAYKVMKEFSQSLLNAQKVVEPFNEKANDAINKKGVFDDYIGSVYKVIGNEKSKVDEKITQVNERINDITAKNKQNSDELNRLNTEKEAKIDQNNQLDADMAYLNKVKDVLQQGKNWYELNDVKERKELDDLKEVMKEKQSRMDEATATFENRKAELTDKSATLASEFEAKRQTVMDCCEKQIQDAADLKQNTEKIAEATKNIKIEMSFLAGKKQAFQVASQKKLIEDNVAYKKNLNDIMTERTAKLTAVAKSGKKFGSNSEYFENILTDITSYNELLTQYQEQKNTADWTPEKQQGLDSNMKKLEKSLETYIKNRDTHKNKKTELGQQRLDAIKSLYNNLQKENKLKEQYALQASKIKTNLEPVKPTTLIEANLLKKGEFISNEQKNVIADMNNLANNTAELSAKFKDYIKNASVSKKSAEVKGPEAPEKKKNEPHIENPEMSLNH